MDIHEAEIWKRLGPCKACGEKTARLEVDESKVKANTLTYRVRCGTCNTQIGPIDTLDAAQDEWNAE